MVLPLRHTQERQARPTLAGWSRVCLTVACFSTLPAVTMAQVLRIGGFDLNATAHLDGIYSSNVERERPDQSSGSRSDYYVVAKMDLTGSRLVGPGTTVDLDAGYSDERHFVRDDLDRPYGNIGLRSITEAGRATIGVNVDYIRTAEPQKNAFSPQGLGSAYDPRSTFDYGVNANYVISKITMNGSYEHRFETHDLSQFQDQNQDEDRFNALVAYRVVERFSPGYSYENTKTTYENNPSNDHTTSNQRFLFPLIVWKKPQLVYTFTWQYEDQGTGIPPEWKPRNTVSLSDTRELAPNLSLSYTAQYDNYPQPAQDQIQFTYGAMLAHKISRTADHSVSVQRQPAKTLGSTLQSDQTTYQYTFSKQDLFIYNLNFMASAGYEHTIPEGNAAEPAQNTIRYDTYLQYRVDLTRRLSRALEYRYSYEDLNTNPEKLVEHRVTLSYQYSF